MSRVPVAPWRENRWQDGWSTGDGLHAVGIAAEVATVVLQHHRHRAGIVRRSVRGCGGRILVEQAVSMIAERHGIAAGHALEVFTVPRAAPPDGLSASRSRPMPSGRGR